MNFFFCLTNSQLDVVRLVAEFLVKFLEQEVCRLHWDVGFVTVTMQEIGVQLPRLLEVYDQLFKTRVRTHTRTDTSRLALFTNFPSLVLTLVRLLT